MKVNKEQILKVILSHLADTTSDFDVDGIKKNLFVKNERINILYVGDSASYTIIKNSIPEINRYKIYFSIDDNNLSLVADVNDIEFDSALKIVSDDIKSRFDETLHTLLSNVHDLFDESKEVNIRFSQMNRNIYRIKANSQRIELLEYRKHFALLSMEPFIVKKTDYVFERDINEYNAFFKSHFLDFVRIIRNMFTYNTIETKEFEDN